MDTYSCGRQLLNRRKVPLRFRIDSQVMRTREEPLMWAMIASLEPVVQALASAFTSASFVTHGQFFLAWVLCSGKHRLGRVADNTQPQQLRDHSQRHGLDTYYYFFERSAWNPATLAYRVAVLILTRLQFAGPIT